MPEKFQDDGSFVVELSGDQPSTAKRAATRANPAGWSGPPNTDLCHGWERKERKGKITMKKSLVFLFGACESRDTLNLIGNIQAANNMQRDNGSANLALDLVIGSTDFAAVGFPSA